ncbi:MAG: trehalose-phosphatase [Rhodocyclaceae bacterium]
MNRREDARPAAPQAAPAPDAERWAFFFDIDGTLLEIAQTPSGVRADGVLVAMIARLRACAGGAVALISGRRIADVDALFPDLGGPIAGQHGMERRDARGALHRHAPEGVDWARLRAEVDAAMADKPGLLIEDKGLTLAVHYRQAPGLRGHVARVLGSLVAQAGGALELQQGKCVMELKPAGRDKGTAIAEFMEEAPFRGRLPVFIGDDVTDEYGFVIANSLGGSSVKVGPGKTAARSRLAGVAAVRVWLDAILAQCPDEP